MLEQVQVEVGIKDIVWLADNDNRAVNAIEYHATSIDNLAMEFGPCGRRAAVRFCNLVPADAQLGESRYQSRNKRVLATRQVNLRCQK